MADNPMRDISSAIFTRLGYTVVGNWIDNKRHLRNISLTCPTPKFKGTADRNAWKRKQLEDLKQVGLECWDEEIGDIRGGVFFIGGRLPNTKIPGYIPKVKADSVKPASTLPESVAKYLTYDLGRNLDEVAAHRHVNSDEPKYAVLMQPKESVYFLVVFVGQYEARHPLGDYEEATTLNAKLVKWDCLYDAEDWNGSVNEFKFAKPDRF